MSPDGAGQLAFDFEELAREEARGRLDEWSGAPLRFTTGYYPPRALDAAFEHWCFLNGRFDSLQRSHMWSRVAWAREEVELGSHRVAVFSANLGPERGAEGPGRGGVTQAICEPASGITSAGTRTRQSRRGTTMPFLGGGSFR